MITNPEKYKILNFFNKFHRSEIYLFLLSTDDFWKDIETFIPALLITIALPDNTEPSMVPGDFDVALQKYIKYIKALNVQPKKPLKVDTREQFSFQF